MENIIFTKNKNSPLYVQLYNYFRKLIETGQLKSESKMMSIRRCCDEFGLSKTTVENAYLQLAAEGYIISKPQSGYYVCELNYTENIRQSTKENTVSAVISDKIEFDFTSSSLSTESFDFSLWRRYIKSALRQSERLISYGEYQGEKDLREAVCKYISERRSVVCNESDIVIGAGTQNLLSILCSLIPEKCSVAFIGASFEKGETVFRAYGHECISYKAFPEDINELKRNNIKFIYVSPSHFTKEGDILPINRRLELLNFARENNCIIIEDDYDSEFRYYSKPVPSLQGISGGNEVIYLSTFSKLLLPSIRISFMVLPVSLSGIYSEAGSTFNQNASKLEQIALCQFIRDGHLNYQIKKQRKLFSQKAKALCEKAETILGEKAEARILPAGYLVKIRLKTEKTADEISFALKKKGIIVTLPQKENQTEMILSCTNIPTEKFDFALSEIKEVI